MVDIVEADADDLARRRYRRQPFDGFSIDPPSASQSLARRLQRLRAFGNSMPRNSPSGNAIASPGPRGDL